MIELPPKSWKGVNPTEFESVGPYGDQVNISSMPLQTQQLRWIIMSIEKIVAELNRIELMKTGVV